MRKLLSLIFISFLFLIVKPSSLALCGNAHDLAARQIKSITAITEVFRDGQ